MRIFSRIMTIGVSLVAVVALLAPISHTHAQSGRDCDDNAIIKCGVGSLNELKQKYRENQAGNVTTIFQHFGIGSEGAMDGMVSGRVTRTNQVYIGENLVATNAVTAGRQNMANSTAILGGIAYERPPSVSFNSSSLPALVKMEAGQFKFAVIMSCGNPVKATPKLPEQPPVTPPNVSINKEVRARGQTEWRKTVRLENDRSAEFRITVKNTGKVAINKYVVGDKLPGGMTIEAGSLSVNGKSNNTNGFSGSGITFDQALHPGAEITITFRTMVSTQQTTVRSTSIARNSSSTRSRANSGYSMNDEECSTQRYKNIAFVKVPELPEKEDDATVTTETCEEIPKPPPTVMTVGTTPEPIPPASQPTPASTPTKPLPATGPASIVGIVTVTSMLGAAVHKLKDFYLVILNK